MARNRGKKALYEVIGKSSMRPGGQKAEPLHPEEESSAAQVEESQPQTSEAVVETPVEVEPEPVVEREDADRAMEAEIEAAVEETGVRWRKRPRAVQINAGRVEFSVPYQAAVAVVLVLLLAVIGAYRLGQRSGRVAVGPDTGDVDPGGTGGVSSTAGVPNPAGGTVPPEPVTPVQPVNSANPVASGGSGGSPTTPPITSTGSNRIVIQTFRGKEDLVPVQQYFVSKGIATEIRKIRDTYYLVTSSKYENPGKPGTDGYAARAKIIEIGAGYKAPEGYESFAPNLFRDAFGMKFDD